MKQIGAIQILRAVAALMIVLAHAQDDAFYEVGKTGIAFVKSHALPWDAGVDLFFVISGFIMVHASRRLFETPGASGLFLARRLIRIVPLYWLATTIAVAILALVAWQGKRAFPGLAEIVSSYSFLPFARPEDGQPRPLAAQGWTLNYEMFFYVVFALFVRFRQTVAVAGVTCALTAIVALGILAHPTQTALAYWSDPIILEFAIGMGIACARQQGLRLRRAYVLPLVILGLAVLSLDLAAMETAPNFTVKANGFTRLAGCGLPMALVFGAIVLAEPGFDTRRRSLAFLCRLGDASYALYLFHPFVIVAARKAYLSVGLAHALGYWPLVLADLVLATLLALAIHIAIETPVSLRLQDRLGAKRAPTLRHTVPSTFGP
jgi:peptidoglycan/LPS O-acetylase OafA/YrhL